uniref:Odorant binding protein 12 n=1 Tax=Dendroctonus ponderosae TaxID=77166 RepID=A0A0H3W577_DENPD|nr:odorant binding protein 12 [Dendroctonus ponderosae]
MHFQWLTNVSVFLCILGVAQLVAAGKPNDLFTRITPGDVEVCGKDTGVDRKDFEEAREKGALNHSMLCFLKCAMEKAGFLKDGHLEIDQAKEASPDKMTEPVVECFKAVGPISTCDDIQKVENCLPGS